MTEQLSMTQQESARMQAESAQRRSLQDIDHIAQAKAAIHVGRDHSLTQLSVYIAQAHALIAIAQELRCLNSK